MKNQNSRINSNLKLFSIFISLLLVGFVSCNKTEEFDASNEYYPTTTSRSAIKNIDSIYIVVFQDNVNLVDAETGDLAKAISFKPKFIYKKALKGFSVALSPEKAEKLRKHPKIKSVTAEKKGAFHDTQNNPANWGLDRIDQRNLPLNNQYTYSLAGQEVDIYIFDSGIRLDHTALQGRAIFGIDPTSDADGVDYIGHGTHVAGIAGSSLYGVAKNVRLISAKVGRDFPSESNAIACIDWAIQHHIAGKPAVGNMSWSVGLSTNLETAVTNAMNDGIIMIAAAGNSNMTTGNTSPQNMSSVICVGASNSSDQRASFSNHGSLVDIFAPGENIVSCSNSSTSASVSLSGTSMAAPHVAGSVALYLASNSTATQSQVESWLTQNATTNVLQAIPSGTPNKLLYQTPPIDPGPCLLTPVSGLNLMSSNLYKNTDSGNAQGYIAWLMPYWGANNVSGAMHPNTIYKLGQYSCLRPASNRVITINTMNRVWQMTVTPSGEVFVIFSGDVIPANYSNGTVTLNFSYQL